MRRDAHLAEFERLTGLLARMGRAAVAAIRQATAALLDGDDAAAAAAIGEHRQIADLHREVEELVPALLARQQPVASDLRLVLAAIRMNADMERMGALAGHIATVGVRSAPAVPPSARPVVTAMAEAAATLAEKSSVVLSTRDPVAAMQLGLDDDVTDALNRQLFGLLTDDWREGTAAAVDLAMVGRFYERFCDHAVSVGHQVAYLVTGSVVIGRL
ncbi:MAG TPA: phosphate signaling complex protein PhoU [Actinoplanes sp.]|nr:phosphate signaling complex protein PhoU [Actinoplanes sp.]